MKQSALFVILISVLALFSCSPPKDIQGVWMGAYTMHKSRKGVVGYSPINGVLDLRKDTSIILLFNFPDDFNKGSIDIDTSIFKHRSKSIVFKDSSDKYKLTIESTSQDSIVFRYSPYAYMVFKRIEEPEAPMTISLKGRTYEFEGPNGYAIDFTNDKFMFSLNEDFGLEYDHWAIVSYRNYNFMLWDHLNNTVPLLIHTYNESSTEMSLYHTKVTDFKMNQLTEKVDTTHLLGNWVQIIDTSSASIPPPPPPPSYSGDADNPDPRIYLTITKDNIIQEFYDSKEVRNWMLNSTNAVIYFPDKHKGSARAWKIVSLSADTLKIKRRFPGLETWIAEYDFVKMKGN